MPLSAALRDGASQNGHEVDSSISRGPAAPTLAKGQADPQFAAVQQFLARFGYLPSAGSRRRARGGGRPARQHDVRSPRALSEAARPAGHRRVRRGDADADVEAPLRHAGPGQRRGRSSTRCAWPTPQLTFAFEDGTADTAGEFHAVRAAFATWAAAVPITFTEVGATQSPDVAIDWRPAADPDHSMIGGILAHADFPPACGVITNTLPKPLHFDDSEHAWSVGAVPNAFDVETVALHELGHILGLQHSDVPGSVMFPSVDDNTTNRVLTADDLRGIRQLYPTAVLANGTYTVRQKSSSRFLDAHEIESKDFRAGDAAGAEQRHAALDADAGRHGVRDPAEEQRPVPRRARGVQQRLPDRDAAGREQRDAALGLDGRRRRQRHAAAVEQPPLHGRARDRVEGLRAGDAAGADQRHAAVDADAGRRQHLHDPAEEQRPLHGRPRDRLEGLPGGHPPGAEQRHPALGARSQSAPSTRSRRRATGASSTRTSTAASTSAWSRGRTRTTTRSAGWCCRARTAASPSSS